MDILKEIQNNKDEVIRRSFKYLIQWLAIVIAAKCIPTQELKMREVIMIAIVGSITFAMLEIYAPAVGQDTTEDFTGMIGVRD